MDLTWFLNPAVFKNVLCWSCLPWKLESTLKRRHQWLPFQETVVTDGAKKGGRGGDIKQQIHRCIFLFCFVLYSSRAVSRQKRECKVPHCVSLQNGKKNWLSGHQKALKGLKRGMAFNSRAMVIKLLVTDVAANLALPINVALYNNNTAPGVVTQIQSLAGIIRKINPTWADRCALSRRDTKQKSPSCRHVHLSVRAFPVLLVLVPV